VRVRHEREEQLPPLGRNPPF
jgi:hypothetical protein